MVQALLFWRKRNACPRLTPREQSLQCPSVHVQTLSRFHNVLPVDLEDRCDVLLIATEN
ncbi:hypothetical protein NCHU2750_53850 (plasmid) [Neorhizobium sp. NCHU2750]|nr:hypothetical protein NCHU2750_53850 [Neorhizobium sp. NCHU2750]